MPEKWQLEQMRSLPLEAKVVKSQLRIREWYEHWSGDVYISFSGGKDSTVLAHLVHDMYPDVPMVFSNTGLEYPEIQRFARENGAKFIAPDIGFVDVITNYGYPIISKEVSQSISIARRTYGDKWRKQKRDELMGLRMNGEKKSAYNKTKWLRLCQETDFLISEVCCKVMKKGPFKRFETETKQKPFIGNLADESKLREQSWLRHGCNAFDSRRKTSNPLSFWLEQDVLEYIRRNKIEIASVYGRIISVDNDGHEYDLVMDGCGKLKCTGCDRTGCIFCGFSTHLEKGETKFQRLKKTHPRQWEYCMEGGEYVDNPNYVPDLPEFDGGGVEELEPREDLGAE